MSNPKIIRSYVEEALQSERLAVLATEGDGQPHASLIAITPFEGIRQLVFATYRNTRKYRNMALNSKVAVLMERGNDDRTDPRKSFVITAFGHAQEITTGIKGAALQALLAKHPNLESFTYASDCALVLVTVNEYQVVQGIDNAMCWSVEDLDIEK